MFREKQIGNPWDLNKGTHEPYTKPNTFTMRATTRHPSQGISLLPSTKGLIKSFPTESFKKAAPLYQSAINHSGYNYQLTFEADTTSNVESKTETNNANQPPEIPPKKSYMVQSTIQ